MGLTTTGQDADSLGDYGESVIRELCSRAAINVNESIRDRGGWDLLLEIGPDEDRSNSTAPLDLRPGVTPCFVQVKTTTLRAKRVQLTLSVWQKLVQHPCACFVVVVVVDDDKNVHAVHLAHVGEQLIADTLNRLRTIDPTMDARLNRKRMALAMNESTRLPSPTAEALLAALRASLGPNPGEYSVAKASWLANAGYEGGRMELTVRTHLEQDEVAFAAMAEFAVGLRAELPIELLTVREVRFGVPRPWDAGIPTGLGVLSCPSLPSLGSASMEVVDERAGERAIVDGELLSSYAMFPFLPKTHHTIRLLNDVGSLVLVGDRMSITVRLDPEMDFDLKALASFARIVRLLRRVEERKLVVTARLDQKEVSVGYSAGGLSYPNELSLFGRGAEDAQFLADDLGLPASIPVTQRSLAAQASTFHAIRTMMAGSGTHARAECVLRKPPRDLSGAWAILSLVQLHLGDFHLLYLLGISSDTPRITRADGGPRILLIGPPTIRRKWALRTSEARRFKLKPVVKDVVAEIEQEGVNNVVTMEP